MEFISVVLITLACISASYYVLNQFFIKPSVSLPGSENENWKKFVRGTPEESLDALNLLMNIYPSPFQIRLNNTSSIVIYEPNHIKTILQSRHCLEKRNVYKFLKSIFGVGLLTAPASIWTQNRQIIASSFNLNTLQEFFDTFVEQSLILVNKLEKVGQNGNKIIFFKHIKRCALDITCDSMLRIKIDSNKKNQYFKAIGRLKEILMYRIYSILIYNKLLIFNVIFNLTALGREQQKIIKLKSLFIKNILQEQYGDELEMNRININKTHTTFINNLMETFWEKKCTKESIIDNVLTLIFKATDTISVTLDFTVFMLANFPKIQEKVCKELEEIYGTKTPMSAPVKYEDLQHMHYLDRVLKETMRLFPTIPVIVRELTEDMKIGETTFPKNSNIIIAFMQMYRNEEYWLNPLKFDPDRFLPERIKDSSSFYYIPFSDGPRNCIGINYAMNSMKVILATLIRTFVLKVDKHIEINEIELKWDLTGLSPIEPFKIIIEKRNL